MSGVKIVMNSSTNKLISDRGLERGGAVQMYVDNAVLNFCEPMVPLLHGDLKGSGKTETVVGSGEVRYGTPYGRRQYFENRGKGLRGKKWFERMKTAHKKEILDGAKKIGGAK